jgi:hypothetical protein
MPRVRRFRSMRTVALVLPMAAILVGCVAVPPPAAEDRAQADNAPLDRGSMPAPRLLSRASAGFCTIVDAYTGECATD